MTKLLAFLPVPRVFYPSKSQPDGHLANALLVNVFDFSEGASGGVDVEITLWFRYYLVWNQFSLFQCQNMYAFGFGTYLDSVGGSFDLSVC